MSPLVGCRFTATMRPFSPDNPALLGKSAQEVRIERCIEVKGIGNGWQRIVRFALDMSEAIAGEDDRVEQIVPERLGEAQRRARSQ